MTVSVTAVTPSDTGIYVWESVNINIEVYRDSGVTRCHRCHCHSPPTSVFPSKFNHLVLGSSPWLCRCRCHRLSATSSRENSYASRE